MSRNFLFITGIYFPSILLLPPLLWYYSSSSPIPSFYSWNSVPSQALQIIPDWVIFIFIENNIYSCFDHTLTCYFIILFLIHFQIVLIHICNRRTVIFPHLRRFFTMSILLESSFHLIAFLVPEHFEILLHNFWLSTLFFLYPYAPAYYWHLLL